MANGGARIPLELGDRRQHPWHLRPAWPLLARLDEEPTGFLQNDAILGLECHGGGLLEAHLLPLSADADDPGDGGCQPSGGGGRPGNTVDLGGLAGDLVDGVALGGDFEHDLADREVLRLPREDLFGETLGVGDVPPADMDGNHLAGTLVGGGAIDPPHPCLEVGEPASCVGGGGRCRQAGFCLEHFSGVTERIGGAGQPCPGFVDPAGRDNEKEVLGEERRIVGVFGDQGFRGGEGLVELPLGGEHVDPHPLDLVRIDVGLGGDRIDERLDFVPFAERLVARDLVTDAESEERLPQRRVIGQRPGGQLCRQFLGDLQCLPPALALLEDDHFGVSRAGRFGCVGEGALAGIVGLIALAERAVARRHKRLDAPGDRRIGRDLGPDALPELKRLEPALLRHRHHRLGPEDRHRILAEDR